LKSELREIIHYRQIPAAPHPEPPASTIPASVNIPVFPGIINEKKGSEKIKAPLVNISTNQDLLPQRPDHSHYPIPVQHNVHSHQTDKNHGEELMDIRPGGACENKCWYKVGPLPTAKAIPTTITGQDKPSNKTGYGQTSACQEENTIQPEVKLCLTHLFLLSCHTISGKFLRRKRQQDFIVPPCCRYNLAIRAPVRLFLDSQMTGMLSNGINQSIHSYHPLLSRSLCKQYSPEKIRLQYIHSSRSERMTNSSLSVPPYPLKI